MFLHSQSPQLKMPHRPVERLERPAGRTRSSNQALQRGLQRCACGSGGPGTCPECQRKKELGLQAKLAIGRVNDPLEHEAEQVARQVTRETRPTVGAPDEVPTREVPGISRRATSETADPSAAPPIVETVLQSHGTPLPAAARADMEAGFGRDFSHVRIHRDARAAESAQAVDALAYTVGSQIVFGSGQFQPHTTAGRRLLAHELTHTVQQGTVATSLARQARPTVASRQRLIRQIQQEMIDRANRRGLEMMNAAFVKLTNLERAVTTAGVPDNPELQDTLDAVRNRFFISPEQDGISGYRIRLRQIIDAIINVLVLAPTLAIRSRGHGRCSDGSFATVLREVAPNEINICPLFFEQGGDCQRDVIVHERFHLLGIHHGGPPGSLNNPPAPPATFDRAMDSAGNLTFLITEATKQPEVHPCP